VAHADSLEWEAPSQPPVFEFAELPLDLPHGGAVLGLDPLDDQQLAGLLM
jgi:hypothetical protein